jgi:(1->4)-alpha-D-glucan 1-alpha-D-glucosylmutase
LPFKDSDHCWKGLLSETVVTTNNALMLSAALKDFSVNLFIQTA